MNSLSEYFPTLQIVPNSLLFEYFLNDVMFLFLNPSFCLFLSSIECNFICKNDFIRIVTLVVYSPFLIRF